MIAQQTRTKLSTFICCGARKKHEGMCTDEVGKRASCKNFNRTIFARFYDGGKNPGEDEWEI
jgi:hypothetical protein